MAHHNSHCLLDIKRDNPAIDLVARLSCDARKGILSDVSDYLLRLGVEFAIKDDEIGNEQLAELTESYQCQLEKTENIAIEYVSALHHPLVPGLNKFTPTGIHNILRKLKSKTSDSAETCLSYLFIVDYLVILPTNSLYTFIAKGDPMLKYIYVMKQVLKRLKSILLKWVKNGESEDSKSLELICDENLLNDCSRVVKYLTNLQDNIIDFPEDIKSMYQSYVFSMEKLIQHRRKLVIKKNNAAHTKKNLSKTKYKKRSLKNTNEITDEITSANSKTPKNSSKENSPKKEKNKSLKRPGSLEVLSSTPKKQKLQSQPTPVPVLPDDKKASPTLSLSSEHLNETPTSLLCDVQNVFGKKTVNAFAILMNRSKEISRQGKTAGLSSTPRRSIKLKTINQKLQLKS